MSLTYSQAMELPCEFEEICGVAEVPTGTAFAVVLLKLISTIESLRRSRGGTLLIRVVYDRDDAGGNGLDRNGAPLSRDALREVLTSKVRGAEMKLAGLKEQLAAVSESGEREEVHSGKSN